MKKKVYHRGSPKVLTKVKIRPGFGGTVGVFKTKGMAIQDT